MSCSSLSVLTHLAMFIGSHFLNGTVYKDDVGRVTALRLANTDPRTHHTSYTVLSTPIHSNCFEKSHPLLLNDISTKWIPTTPLIEWDKDELADELTECKNSFRTLKHRHITQGRNLYSIKKTLWNRINAMKSLRTTPKPEKKIAIRPVSRTSVVHVSKPYVAPPKTVVYKEPEKIADPLRHNLVSRVNRVNSVQKKYRRSHRHRSHRHRSHRHRSHRHRRRLLRPIKKQIRKLHKKIKKVKG